MSKLYNAVLLSLFLLACQQDKEIKPNVLVILADDLGYMDLGCYGSSFYETPNLDRLAKDGIQFSQGYASCPVCSPTRASLQTGKYPTKLHITDWIPGRAAFVQPSERNRLIDAKMENQLALEEITLAEIMREYGYKTFFAGKWHLGESEEYWPESQGYEINKGGWSKGSPQLRKQEGYMGYFAPYGNPKLKDGPDGEFLPNRITDETLTFIESNKKDAFYTMLSFYLVHTPLQAEEEIIEKYKLKAIDLGLDTVQPFLEPQPWMFNNAAKETAYKERIIQSHATYAAMMEALDRNVGRVIDKLKALDLYDQTMIIFTSDNGGLSTSEGSPTANRPLRGGKGWLYEGGIRVPWLIKYPNQRFENLASTMPISTIDVLPTVLGATNIQHHVDGIDGIDIAEHLMNWDYKKRPLLWHYPHYSNQGGMPGSVILVGEYKLIDNFETGEVELYNLTEDLGEEHNLAQEMPEKAAELLERLENWRKESGAKMMAENPAWNGNG